MDPLDKPFIGYPRAPKPRAKGFRKTYADTWLDDFLKGFLGDESPAGGTVLEPEKKEKRESLKRAGELAGIVTDVPKGLLSLPFLAAGAIRKGGAKDLLATHAFNPSYAPQIAESGVLRSPSIGITSRNWNEYAPANPAFVFAAGKADPGRGVAGAMTNRDGYFYNPQYLQKTDPDALAEEIRDKIAEMKQAYGVNDLRLGQFWPGTGQGFGIAASPNFKSYAEFEKSPYGAQLLRIPERARAPYWRAIERDLAENAQLMLGSTAYGTTDTYTKALAKRAAEHGPEHLTNFELQLWERAKRMPSGMAEQKVYGDLPLNPIDTSIFFPLAGGRLGDLSKLADFRDAGFKIFNELHLAPREFAGKAHQAASPWTRAQKNFPLVADERGGFNLPRDLTIPNEQGKGVIGAADWNDFINPLAGGSPSDPWRLPRLKPSGWIDLDTFKHVEDLGAEKGPAKIKAWLDAGHIDQEQADKLTAAGMKKWAPPLPKEGGVSLGTMLKEDLDSFPTGAEATAWLEKQYENGWLPELQYEAGVKYLDQKWPIQPAGQASQSLAEIFGVPALKAGKPVNTSAPDDWTKQWNPDSSLHLSKDKIPAFMNLMNEADEYMITLEDFVKTHSVKPALHDALMDKTWELYQKELHKKPAWHSKLETALTETLVHSAWDKPPKIATKPTSPLQSKWEDHLKAHSNWDYSTQAHSFLQDNALFSKISDLMDKTKAKMKEDPWGVVPLGEDYDKAAELAIKEGADPLAVNLWLGWYKDIWKQ